MAKFGTNADCITCWPNFQPMQVTFSFAGEITQVLDVIPWVRCASGNVLTGTPLKITRWNRERREEILSSSQVL